MSRGLRLRQTATGSTVQIVPPSALPYVGVTFSPGGNFIDYVRRENHLTGYSSLYQVPVLGGTPVKLLFDIDTAVSFSPDGKQFAFVRGEPAHGTTNLMVANADGSNVHALATRKFPKTFVMGGMGEGPAWSPDGKVIAVAAGTTSPLDFHPVAVDVSTGRVTEIGSRHWFQANRVAWMPSGKGLLVIASEFSSPWRHQIWRVSYPDGHAGRLTNDLNDYLGVSATRNAGALATVETRQTSNIWVAAKGEWEHPRQITQGLSNADGYYGLSWTRDGDVVYVSGANGSDSLRLVKPENRSVQKIAQHGANNELPSVCGGTGFVTLVTAAKTETGGLIPDIWRVDLDGSNLKPVTSGQFALFPSCSPDGRWITYNSQAGGEFELWRSSTRGGNPIPLTQKPQSASYGTISPDGKWIACAYRTDERKPWELAPLPSEGANRPEHFSSCRMLPLKLSAGCPAATPSPTSCKRVEYPTL